ncbi:MAG: FecR domain-containing protein [Chloroflexi bacterium]|nr:FecR domain-containing protein [Chloroflexota bacterium]
MVKRAVLFIVLIPLVVIGAGFAIFFAPYLSSEPLAVLRIEKGSVEISSGARWIPASSGMRLKPGWRVRTGEDGKASIVFYGDSVARLDENTEVSIKELKVADENLSVELDQASGKAWHRILPVGRIGSYVVDTPIGSFSATGTSFGTIVSSTETRVLNLEGVVVAIVDQKESEKRLIVIPSMVQVNFPTLEHLVMENPWDSSSPENVGLEIGIELACGSDRWKPFTYLIEKKAFIPEDVRYETNVWALEHDLANAIFLVKRREQLMKKYDFHISIANSLGLKLLGEKITDDTLINFIDGYLRGDIDVNDMISRGEIPKQYAFLIPPTFRHTSEAKSKKMPESTQLLIAEAKEDLGLVRENANELRNKLQESGEKVWEGELAQGDDTKAKCKAERKGDIFSETLSLTGTIAKANGEKIEFSQEGTAGTIEKEARAGESIVIAKTHPGTPEDDYKYSYALKADIFGYWSQTLKANLGCKLNVLLVGTARPSGEFKGVVYVHKGNLQGDGGCAWSYEGTGSYSVDKEGNGKVSFNGKEVPIEQGDLDFARLYSR